MSDFQEPRPADMPPEPDTQTLAAHPVPASAARNPLAARTPARRWLDRLLWVAMLALCVYWVYTWPGPFRGILGIVGGVFCLLMLAADLFMSFLSSLSPAGAAGDVEGVADEMESLGKKLYGGPHEYRFVPDDEYDAFMRRRRDWVAAIENDLRLINFSRLMTIEDMTARAAMPQVRAFIRVFRYERDRATTASFYSPRVTGLFRLLQLIRVLPANMDEVAFETELSDGRFLLTSTAVIAARTEEVPGIVRSFVDPQTPVGQIFETHQRRLRAELAADPGLSVVRIDSPEAAIAAQHRQEAIKTRHRAGRGYLTAEDLRRQGDASGDELLEVLQRRQEEREARQREAARRAAAQAAGAARFDL